MKQLFYFLTTIFLIVSIGTAAEYRTGQSVYLTAKDTLKSDLFAGAETVTISGILLGDIFAGCKHLDIKGEVEDDVIAGCQTLRIGNKVGDQVIGFAQNITIDSEVGGDVMAYAEEVWITKNAHILGNLHVGTANLNFEGGIVEGKILGGAGRAYLNGKVFKNVDISLGSVKFGEDYNAMKGTNLKLHEALDENAEFVPDDLEITYHESKHFFQSWFFYWSLVSMFVVGVLLISIFKNFFFDLVTYAKQDIWKNLGFGAIIFVVVPIAIVIMLVLVITIPVSLILLAAYLVVLYLSSIITGLVFGDYVVNMLKKNGNSKQLIWSLLLGVILITLIPNIPAIGWLFCLLFICFGMGTLILFVYQSFKLNKQAA
jgi:hypothetical protein